MSPEPPPPAQRPFERQRRDQCEEDDGMVPDFALAQLGRACCFLEQRRQRVEIGFRNECAARFLGEGPDSSGPQGGC